MSVVESKLSEMETRMSELIESKLQECITEKKKQAETKKKEKAAKKKEQEKKKAEAHKAAEKAAEKKMVEIMKKTMDAWKANEEKAKKRQQEEAEKALIHDGYICDGCDQPIKGIRYHSLGMHDYDLCEKCQPNMHKDHLMIRIATKEQAGAALGFVHFKDNLKKMMNAPKEVFNPENKYGAMHANVKL
jgi:flagellar biosynthesis GTPase FlhF